MNSLFVVIEGIDGCGKTTATLGAAAKLTELGCDTLITQEPTVNNETGLKIKNILTH